ncbi:histone deacetylase 5 [Dorcoceras hygrometricum]|nr:histone deacetylase 5 [Dorcoceras hygrometricum]
MESNAGMESSLDGENTSDPTIRRRVGLLYDDRMCKHENPDDEYHPENPNRIRVIWDKLNSCGICQRCVILKAKEVDDNSLALVHDKSHIELIKNVSSKYPGPRRNRMAAKFNSIYFNDGSSEAACLAAGSVIEVAEKVARGELDSGFAIVRPPGHHAEKTEPMGFCLYNNVAVATSHLLNDKPEFGISKILIVDWDVHHGNGTQNMFYNDPRVLFFSVHRHEFGSFYPASDDGSYFMIGEGPGSGYNINVPWENGMCGDADYLAVWDHILIPVVKEFNPELILISAGFDAAIGDPLGGCRVSPYGYSIMLDKLMEFAGGKIVLALEGGYNLNSLANSAQACVEVLLQHKPISGSLEAYPLESTWRVIQAVRQELSEYWPTLAANLTDAVKSRRTSYIKISSSDSEAENENSLHTVTAELNVVEDVVQPFLNLKVNEDGQDKEAVTVPSWRSELSKIDIWYATYGSNMNASRLRCYIEGGQIEGMRRPCVGAVNKSPWKEIMWKTFPHRLFFARDYNATWGAGGVAFLHPESNFQEKTYMCLYKISLEQFNDVFKQENISSYDMSQPLFDLTALETIESKKCILVELVKRGWYHNVVYLGKENDIPILTMTCTLSDIDNFISGVFPINPPRKEYATMLVKGLVEGNQLTEKEALDYIKEASTKPL